MPKAANKVRPAVVVEGAGLFAPNYPNLILVPLTDDRTLVVASLSVQIVPSVENGCTKTCWAAAHLVTATSKSRVRPTATYVTPDQLEQIRRQIAFAVGLED